MNKELEKYSIHNNLVKLCGGVDAYNRKLAQNGANIQKQLDSAKIPGYVGTGAACASIIIVGAILLYKSIKNTLNAPVKAIESKSESGYLTDEEVNSIMANIPEEQRIAIQKAIEKRKRINTTKRETE